MRRSLLTAAVMFCLHNTTYADDPFVYAAEQIRTAAVNENGQRHDAESTECVSAPNGRLFKQSVFKQEVLNLHDASEHSCSMSFGDFEEVVPGITEPKKVCLRSWVVSVGGFLNIGKRGHLKCGMRGAVYDGVEHRSIARVAPVGGRTDVTLSAPTLPADLTLERERRSLVTASIPLSFLQSAIDEGLRTSPPKLPAGLKLTVMSSRFEEYHPESRVITFYVDVDISGFIGARCDIRARISIPAARLRDMVVQEVGSDANCRSGSFLGQLADFPARLNGEIRKNIADAMKGKIFQGSETFSDWVKEDPKWAEFLDRGVLQGLYCDWRGAPGLCLRLGWPGRDAVDVREAELLANAPSPLGPVDKAAAFASLHELRLFAVEKLQSQTSAGFKYPAGRDAEGRVEDGDMSIFGGLLCASGEPLGCDLIRNSNADGRFWRSPRRVGEADTREHASFSGDQMKGVIAFLAQTSEFQRLDGLLSYLKGKPTNVPNDSHVLETGYSSCPNFGPNFTCFVGGFDWFALGALAKKANLEAALPSDYPALMSRYGFTYDGMIWESLLTNNGYRLHLIAVQLHLLRMIGETDPRLAVVAKILAGREPQNAFMVYLHLGADERVRKLADAKCAAPETRTDFTDWQWQRAEADDAWSRSMVWDCVFVYGLLSK